MLILADVQSITLMTRMMLLHGNIVLCIHIFYFLIGWSIYDPFPLFVFLSPVLKIFRIALRALKSAKLIHVITFQKTTYHGNKFW